MGGPPPSMPDSAPKEYKKLAKRCCDADSDKLPDARSLYYDINELISKSYDNVWNAVYHNGVKPLSRLRRRVNILVCFYLLTGDLPKPRNSYDMDSAAGMVTR